MKKFTLIEVLVVVAIIGILASLLLPSLSKAKKTTKGALCKNRLKQLHVMSSMYSDDNDHYFLHYPQGSNNPDKKRWYKQFTVAGLPYSLSDGHLKMLECPVNIELYPKDGNPSYHRNFGMNEYLIGYNYNDVRQPANKILYGDGFSHTNNEGIGQSMYSNAINHGNRAGGVVDYIHDGKKNLVHVDGHVDSSTRAYLLADPSLWERD